MTHCNAQNVCENKCYTLDNYIPKWYICWDQMVLLTHQASTDIIVDAWMQSTSKVVSQITNGFYIGHPNMQSAD